MTPEHYRDQFYALLTRSDWIWNRDPESNMAKFVLAIADEFSRIDQRADDLIRESDARLTDELLTDWERYLGLPDSCSTLPETRQERLNRLVSKLTQRGGASRQYFIDLAASLGFTITITEPAASVWQISHSSVTSTQRVCRSPCGEAFTVVIANSLLECIMNLLKPAHTRVQFITT